MVTRSEAIERMAKMACPQEMPCVPCVEDAEPYLDALLDYLEENQARMLMFGGRVALGHALVSELVALLKEAANG